MSQEQFDVDKFNSEEAHDCRIYICPRCGYISSYEKTNRFPICYSCKYENIIDLNRKEVYETINSVEPNAVENAGGYTVKKETHDKADEILREKYVYNNPAFSKAAYHERIRQEEEFHSSPATPSAIHCPHCGSTDFDMVPRKWSLLTGFLTNKVDRVCRRCKKRF